MRIRIYGWEVISPLGQSQPAVDQQGLLQALRDMRDVLLKESDWTQMPDSPLSEEIKNDWRIWRQQMRDIVQTTPSPLSYTVELPAPPATGRPKSWDNWDLNYLSTLPNFQHEEEHFMQAIQEYIDNNSGE